MKKIAISQSNYIPWKGYFDLIGKVDEFILYDDMQYTCGDWRNRNKIKTPKGGQWLTVPVKAKGFPVIRDVKVCDNIWPKKHWKSIVQNYSKSKYFNEYKDVFELLYSDVNEKYLSEINYKFIIEINKILNIRTRIRCSSEFNLSGDKTEKILGICKDCNADIYLSGPSAKVYFNEKLAYSEGVKVEWMDYSNYKEYRQLHPPFIHEVSVLDLIFNEGPYASELIKNY